MDPAQRVTPGRPRELIRACDETRLPPAASAGSSPGTLVPPGHQSLEYSARPKCTGLVLT